jgi:hypothetical protein
VSRKITRIYVELDALLDSRIAVISSLDQRAAARLFNDPRYLNRASDDMGRIAKSFTNEAYQAAYAKRDVDILVNSRLTGIVLLLGQMLAELEKNATRTPFTEDVELHVNTYPYVLDAEESHQLMLSIHARASLRAEIKIIHMPIHELTMTTVKAMDYAALLMYNARQWAELAMVKNEQEKIYLPAVTLMGPQLLKTEEMDLTKEDLTAPDGTVWDPFDAVRLLLAELIHVEFLPIDLFCLIDPQEIEQPPA